MQAAGRFRRAAPARSYNFASTRFKECFGNGLPIADGVKLRADTVAYLDTEFDPKVSFGLVVTSSKQARPRLHFLLLQACSRVVRPRPTPPLVMVQ